MTIHPQLIDWHTRRHPDASHVPNQPIQKQSTDALLQLSETILRPIEERFGALTISYGFTSFKLLNYIKKHHPGQMAPQLDQHAAYELNSRGNRICKRNGASCDITTSSADSAELTTFIVQQLAFDKIYFYGANRPLHVSIGPNPAREIWQLVEIDGKTYPKRIQQLEDMER